jgi:hypothetical protein
MVVRSRKIQLAIKDQLPDLGSVLDADAAIAGTCIESPPGRGSDDPSASAAV